MNDHTRTLLEDATYELSEAQRAVTKALEGLCAGRPPDDVELTEALVRIATLRGRIERHRSAQVETPAAGPQPVSGRTSSGARDRGLTGRGSRAQ
ncbi:hypothetical protein ER308_01465 [Egibacter rhizosphaerae]|uniref:Uncharacterized protein n=1 Tax=Egibacter rhizosphaerae TaxID=1670831 RepID=A0A411YB12_9ACTN|nr:hypothetical protein [Egibacter rhizosphaerae]QBI18369.1 hypothetical protein ER308_01465 [Egibacter rhizosphaerae]